MVQYKTIRCRDWVLADTRSVFNLALDRSQDWLKVSCVTETRILSVDLQNAKIYEVSYEY